LRNGNKDMVLVLRQIGAKEFEEYLSSETSNIQDPTKDESIEDDSTAHRVNVNDETSNSQDEDMSHKSYDTGIVVNGGNSPYLDQLAGYGQMMRAAMEISIGTTREEIVSIFGEPEGYDDYYYYPVTFHYDEGKVIGMIYAYAMPYHYDITREGIQRGASFEEVYDTYSNYRISTYYNDIHDYPKFIFVEKSEEIHTFEFSRSEFDGSLFLVGYGRGNETFIKNSSIINYQTLEQR
ncbi:MAG: hypothetical protein LRY71_14510, partial [Bacillaceae bacterium]|nr:hypothetical protein [Bacillaceae bacterium]